jgi:hypothetical protein
MGESGVVPNNLQVEFGTAPAAEGSEHSYAQKSAGCLAWPQPQKRVRAKCSRAVLPKMFTFRMKQSQVSPVPENYNVTPLPPRTVAPNSLFFHCI